jgi:hypothetical protein
MLRMKGRESSILDTSEENLQGARTQRAVVASSTSIADKIV